MAEPNFMTGRTDYVAIHKDFEEIQEGFVIPEYMAEFGDSRIYPKWYMVKNRKIKSVIKL